MSPLQNRVDPYGKLVATPARGTLTGNRGCLHNDQEQIVRQYNGKRWIICQLAFKGWHREVMMPRQYTHLFFLDEATALAAGHRPCAECSRARYNDFVGHFFAANANRFPVGVRPSATLMDDLLHSERLHRGRGETSAVRLLEFLPSGVMVSLERGGQPYLWLGNRLLKWSFEGYTPTAIPLDPVFVLTPPSTMRTLAHGYQPRLHLSANS